MDSNSIGGILIQPSGVEGEMPEMKPRRKANKGDQLSGQPEGELATYEQVGLFQHSITLKTAYRYRGILLQYQKALGGIRPSLNTS